jgi:hypothetical protein
MIPIPSARTLVWLAVAFPSVATIASAQVFVKIDPRHTYLRRNNDPAPNPAALALSALGLAPGNVVRIRRLGEFDNGPGTETFGTTIALFSTSSTLLAETNLARVPGALEAGCDWITSPTWSGSLPTDIPEDFVVAIGAGATATQDEVVVEIPTNSTHVFVGPNDSLYWDNTDPDGDYGVEFTVLAPTAWSFLGGGVGGVNGVPSVLPSGELSCGSSIAFAIARAPANVPVFTAIGVSRVDFPIFGGVLVPLPEVVVGLGSTDASGAANLAIRIPITIAPATQVYFQHLMPDPSAAAGVGMTSGVSASAR